MAAYDVGMRLAHVALTQPKDDLCKRMKHPLAAELPTAPPGGRESFVVITSDPAQIHQKPI